jgi:uncharacterized membrane protein
MNPSRFELISTLCFAIAILHTFSVGWFQKKAHQYRKDSVPENIFHLLGEVEVVFGFWAALFLTLLFFAEGSEFTLHYLESLNFNEALFIFVILAICATRPILRLTEGLIEFLSKLLPLNRQVAFYWVALSIGPLLGSFITEPAAMTVIAFLLLNRFFTSPSLPFKYSTLGALFVNVSIGGTLTPFAAPPVLMVAATWGWDLKFMATNFGWKGAIACVITATLVTLRFRKEIAATKPKVVRHERLDFGEAFLIFCHVVMLALVVYNAHHPVLFIGFFLIFLGLTSVTREFQDDLRLKQGLLVAFFLAGLVVLGGPQRWWLEPILNQLSALPLFLGSAALTAVLDNAAITFLGAQVPGLDPLSKYSLVAGAVVGGGLTVIANAPNPAGYSILNPAMGEVGISAARLFLAALLPTLVAGLCFWFL